MTLVPPFKINSRISGVAVSGYSRQSVLDHPRRSSSSRRRHDDDDVDEQSPTNTHRLISARLAVAHPSAAAEVPTTTIRILQRRTSFTRCSSSREFFHVYTFLAEMSFFTREMSRDVKKISTTTSRRDYSAFATP